MNINREIGPDALELVMRGARRVGRLFKKVRKAFSGRDNEAKSEPSDSMVMAITTGEEIRCRKDTDAMSQLLFLFHELGHIIDKQCDIREALVAISDIKEMTIDLSLKELLWLIKQDFNSLRDIGITETHCSIISKILDVILRDGFSIQYDIIPLEESGLHPQINTVR